MLASSFKKALITIFATAQPKKVSVFPREETSSSSFAVANYTQSCNVVPPITALDNNVILLLSNEREFNVFFLDNMESFCIPNNIRHLRGN